VRLALADDAILFREGLARVLLDRGFDVILQAGDADELLRGVAEDRPDVCIVDIRMPPTHTHEGLMAAIELRRSYPGLAILVLSQYVETHYAMELLGEEASGAGYLLKDRVTDLDAFCEAIERVAGGGSAIDPAVVEELLGRRRRPGRLDSLTERERAVLSLMAEGRSNQAIGQHLHLSEKTVEAHIGSIFSKLGLAATQDDNRRVLAVLAHLAAAE
jgi:DNA-binding NarL/FixJ family response regulator